MSISDEVLQQQVIQKWIELCEKHNINLDAPLSQDMMLWARGLKDQSKRENVYVYGSRENQSPHGYGSMRVALRLGASCQISEGMDGPCYALKIADARGFPLDPYVIQNNVRALKSFATKNPQLMFFVGSLDTGWGYPFYPTIVGPSFQRPPDNMAFDERWWKYL